MALEKTQRHDGCTVVVRGRDDDDPSPIAALFLLALGLVSTPVLFSFAWNASTAAQLGLTALMLLYPLVLVGLPLLSLYQQARTVQIDVVHRSVRITTWLLGRQVRQLQLRIEDVGGLVAGSRRAIDLGPHGSLSIPGPKEDAAAVVELLRTEAARARAAPDGPIAEPEAIRRLRSGAQRERS